MKAGKWNHNHTHSIGQRAQKGERHEALQILEYTFEWKNTAAHKHIFVRLAEYNLLSFIAHRALEMRKKICQSWQL